MELRSTSFLTPGSTLDDSSLWADVVGGMPNEERRRPREEIIQQTGVFEESNVTLGVNRLRVDWLVHSDPNDMASTPWPELSFLETIGVLSSLIPKWFAIGAGVNRLAFGAKLVHPEPSWDRSLSTLRHYLPDIDFDDSADFMYRINRPRSSKTLEGLRVNRLCTWSVAVSSGVEVRVGAEGEVQQGSLGQYLASSLELDINTAGDRAEPIPQADMGALFSELITLGIEISERGDIR